MNISHYYKSKSRGTLIIGFPCSQFNQFHFISEHEKNYL